MPFRISRSRCLLAARAVCLDFCNVIRFGLDAPRYAQRIYINPCSVRFAVDAFTRDHSGRVISGDWDRNTVPIHTLNKFQITHRRLSEKLSWEVAGAYASMLALLESRPMPDGCRSIDDIRLRYKNLDDLIDHLSKSGRYLTMEEQGGYREMGGIYVHIGRSGEIIFGGGGAHRLAIAQGLELERVPAQLGVVHREALGSGAFMKLCRTQQ